jgi:hypothetical protein
MVWRRANTTNGETAMRTLMIGLGLVLTLGSAYPIQPTTRSGSSQSQRMSDADALADFEARVQSYVELHRCLEDSIPPVGPSDDYAVVYGSLQALATKIRAARRNARQGDVFTPDTQRVLVQTIRECVKGCNIDDLLASLNEENPKGLVLTPRINGEWPEEASYGPMPPHLLAALPPLPDELQYRFMNRDLVLLDVHANVIVDFIRKALP